MTPKTDPASDLRTAIAAALTSGTQPKTRSRPARALRFRDVHAAFAGLVQAHEVYADACAVYDSAQKNAKPAAVARAKRAAEVALDRLDRVATAALRHYGPGAPEAFLRLCELGLAVEAVTDPGPAGARFSEEAAVHVVTRLQRYLPVARKALDAGGTSVAPRPRRP